MKSKKEKNDDALLYFAPLYFAMIGVFLGNVSFVKGVIWQVVISFALIIIYAILFRIYAKKLEKVKNANK